MDFAERLHKRVLRSHVKAGETGMALADYLTLNFSRFDLAGWQNAISRGMVTLNGTAVQADTLLKEHDCVAFHPGESPEPEAELTFREIYTDEDIVVLDKPGNLCIHPTGPFFRNTLWHIAGQKYGELRFMTRLDRETSGLVIACRNRETASRMSRDLNGIRKEYIAMVFGDFHSPVQAKGILVKDTASAVAKKKKFIPENLSGSAGISGETSDTEFIPVKKLPGGKSLVRVLLHTGRQHQIRATLCSLGFPLVGDKLYGPDEKIFLKIHSCSITEADIALLGMERQALHASGITFRHPRDNRELTFESPCPFGE